MNSTVKLLNRGTESFLGGFLRKGTKSTTESRVVSWMRNSKECDNIWEYSMVILSCHWKKRHPTILRNWCKHTHQQKRGILKLHGRKMGPAWWGLSGPRTEPYSHWCSILPLFVHSSSIFFGRTIIIPPPVFVGFKWNCLKLKPSQLRYPFVRLEWLALDGQGS